MTDAQAIGLVILAAMVALCLFAAFEMRRAVVRDDWTSSGDERAAEWARREVQAAFDRHVADALDGANAEPVFSATIRAMPVSQSALVVAGWLLDGQTLAAETEEWLAGEEG